MASWLPIIKVVLPYVGPIFQAALPAFTKKKDDKTDPVVAQQIAELQEAVKTNSESMRALARAIEEAAQANDRALKRARSIAVAAVIVAVLSLLLAIVSLSG
jgi:uncharacterized protein YPO0396